MEGTQLNGAGFLLLSPAEQSAIKAPRTWYWGVIEEGNRFKTREQELVYALCGSGDPCLTKEDAGRDAYNFILANYRDCNVEYVVAEIPDFGEFQEYGMEKVLQYRTDEVSAYDQSAYVTDHYERRAS